MAYPNGMSFVVRQDLMSCHFCFFFVERRLVPVDFSCFLSFYATDVYVYTASLCISEGIIEKRPVALSLFL